MKPAKKSLGQHWLNDKKSLRAIVEAAELETGETVLEIGSGHGSLTQQLLEQQVKVVAIEKDEALATALASQHLSNLEVVSGDILLFDFSQLPSGYKLVANIPYYLTAHLLRLLGETKNPPTQVVLLVQKEVAQRVVAGPGQMSLVSLSTQLFYEVSLGRIVEARLFSPPPKVDSQILILRRRPRPLFNKLDESSFFRVAKAGFAGRRKKLRSSLSAGVHLPKEQVDQLLLKADIDGNLRAQNLSLADWHKLSKLL